MELKILEILIDIFAVIAALLSFVLVVALSVFFDPRTVLIKTYERVNNRLRERRSGLFDYEKIQGFLQANGAQRHFGKWLTPTSYTVLRLVTALMLFSIGLSFGMIWAVLFMILGFLLPGILVRRCNKADNARMLPQILLLYEALKVQIQAGVYVTDALAECYESLDRGRLKSAMELLTADIYMKADFEEALNKFNRSFSNELIDSLCSILLQAQDSGKIVELLEDMLEEISDIKEEMHEARKRQLDSKTTLYIIGILFVIFVLLIYAGVMYIVKSGLAGSFS